MTQFEMPIVRGQAKLLNYFSHNIRTALTVVNGYLSMMIDGDVDVGADTAQNLKAKIDTVHLYLGQMETLLRNVLTHNEELRKHIRALEAQLQEAKKEL